jgi:hypothetical protein
VDCFVRDLERATFRTSAANPPVVGALTATMAAVVAMQMGHMAFSFRPQDDSSLVFRARSESLQRVEARGGTTRAMLRPHRGHLRTSMTRPDQLVVTMGTRSRAFIERTSGSARHCSSDWKVAQAGQLGSGGLIPP